MQYLLWNSKLRYWYSIASKYVFQQTLDVMQCHVFLSKSIVNICTCTCRMTDLRRLRFVCNYVCVSMSVSVCPVRDLTHNSHWLLKALTYTRSLRSFMVSLPSTCQNVFLEGVVDGCCIRVFQGTRFLSRTRRRDEGACVWWSERSQECSWSELSDVIHEPSPILKHSQDQVNTESFSPHTKHLRLRPSKVHAILKPSNVAPTTWLAVWSWFRRPTTSRLKKFRLTSSLPGDCALSVTVCVSVCLCLSVLFVISHTILTDFWMPWPTPAVPGTKAVPFGMPGTRTVAGTDNRSGKSPVPPGNSSTSNHAGWNKS